MSLADLGCHKPHVKEDSEHAIEEYLVRCVGSIGGMALKFTSPGLRGVPDRLVILPGNRFYFVELKKRTGAIRALQWVFATRVLNVGVNVEFIKSKAEVDAFIKRVSP